MTASEFYQAAGYELSDPPAPPQTLRLNARELSGVDDGLSTGNENTFPNMGTNSKGVITYEAPGEGPNGESSN